MANKRNRQKQRNSSKTLEGYERYLLQQRKKWEDAHTSNNAPHVRQNINGHIGHYKKAHEELREFYFDL